MAEKWRLLGDEGDPVYVTGSLSVSAGSENVNITGSAITLNTLVTNSGSFSVRIVNSGSIEGNANITGSVSLTVTGSTEEYFTTTNTGNSLSEYVTAFNAAATSGMESASVVKGSAGKMYQCLYSNPSSFPVYLQFFDRTSTPNSGLPPSASYRVEASSSLSIDYRSGRPFATGIVVATSFVYGFFTGAASGSFQVFYK